LDDEMVGVPAVTVAAAAGPTARIEQIPMSVAWSVTPGREYRIVFSFWTRSIIRAARELLQRPGDSATDPIRSIGPL
jgi:hypothetical protein